MSKKIGKKPKRGRKSRKKNCLIRDEHPNSSPPNSSLPNPSLPATSLPNPSLLATSLPNPSLPATSKSRSKRAAEECVTEPRVTRRTKK